MSKTNVHIITYLDNVLTDLTFITTVGGGDRVEKGGVYEKF